MAKEFIERGALIARYDAEHVGPPGRARELMATAPAVVVDDRENTMKILRRAIEKYGEPTQIIVAVEECAELQKELTKALRGKLDAEHLAEEMADVQIMLWQLCCMFGIDGQMTKWIDKKVERLNERMEAAETGGERHD